MKIYFKHIALLIGLVIISIQLEAQEEQLQGTLILNNNDTITSSIKKILDKNSFNIEAINNSNERKLYTPNDVKMLIIKDGLIYETIKIPTFEGPEVSVFIECHTLGSVNLYTYIDSELKERFYIRKGMADIRELKNETEVIKNKEGNFLNKKKLYIGELNYALSDCNDKKLKQDIANLKLEKNKLIKLLQKYHSCINKPFTTLNPRKKEKAIVEVGVSGGINYINIPDVLKDIGSTAGLLFNFYLPRTNGRYSLEVGTTWSTNEDEEGKKFSTLSFPFALNRYDQISKSTRTQIKLGIEPALSSQLTPIGLLLGVGFDYQIKEGPVRIFTTLDGRFIGPRKLTLNVGLKYKL